MILDSEWSDEYVSITIIMIMCMCLLLLLCMMSCMTGISYSGKIISYLTLRMVFDNKLDLIGVLESFQNNN